jgi:hypothetical protein
MLNIGADVCFVPEADIPGTDKQITAALSALLGKR